MPEFIRHGIELHYELEGDGPPAVLVPGMGAHSGDPLSQGLRMAFCSQYRLLTVDNRGSGQSRVPPGTVATIDDMADDIAAILDFHGMTNARVLGLSMGGCVAKTLALRHPDKVRCLISAVSLARSESLSRSAFLLETGREMRSRDIPRDLLNRYNVTFLFSEDVFQHEAFIELWINAPPDPLEMNQAGYDLQTRALEHYDIRDRLAQITAPTLVISSPDDLLVPPRCQDEIAALIPGAQIQRYPGGHVFMILPTWSAPFIEDVLMFWDAH